MNKILNALYYIFFTIMLFVMVLIGVFATTSIPFIILTIILFLITLITTIIDICKSRVFSLKHNIFADIVLFIMIIVSIRPILDSTIFTNNVFYIESIDTFVHYAIILYKDYVYVMFILIIILFISNYLDYKLYNLNK